MLKPMQTLPRLAELLAAGAALGRVFLAAKEPVCPVSEPAGRYLAERQKPCRTKLWGTELYWMVLWPVKPSWMKPS
jgi:hypothetical protein